MLNYELIIKNADGTQIKTKYKSIRQMSINNPSIPYHNLKVIADRENKENKYKHSLLNNLMKIISINKIIEL